MQPSIDQMKQVIASGEDDKTYLLVLKTNGKFELKDLTGLTPSQVKFHNVVARFETFAAGTGWVGPDAAEDEIFIKNTFKDMIKYWRLFEEQGVTDMDVMD